MPETQVIGVINIASLDKLRNKIENKKDKGRLRKEEKLSETEVIIG